MLWLRRCSALSSDGRSATSGSSKSWGDVQSSLDKLEPVLNPTLLTRLKNVLKRLQQSRDKHHDDVRQWRLGLEREHERRRDDHKETQRQLVKCQSLLAAEQVKQVSK